MVTALAALAAGLPELVQETAELVERLRRSVVVVRDGPRGGGSGVIWQEDGVIITNHHVAPGHRAQVGLTDGRRFDASVRLSDPAHDLAVLDIPAAGLPAVNAGNSDRLRVGELVFAVGNPLGLSGAVTAGIVTAIPRPESRIQGQGMVQADVSLAPGNSGGLLATADGSVVGITAMVRAPGLALAVPSNLVTQLLARDFSGRAYLGVSLFATELPRAWSPTAPPGTGFVVTAVAPGSPAERAGLILGDVLLRAAGQRLDSSSTLELTLAALRPGGALELEIMRGGQPRSVTVVAGELLDEAA